MNPAALVPEPQRPQLTRRILFGSLMLAALAGLAWLDAHVHRRLQPGPHVLPPGALRFLPPGPILTAVWIILLIPATRELAALLVRAGRAAPVTGWAVACNVALAVVPFLPAGSSSAYDPAADTQRTLALLAAALVGSFVGVAARRRTDGAAADVAFTLLMIVYLGALGSFIPRLRAAAQSPWPLLYVLIVVKSADIGAYFSGLALGRRPLIPWLSPKKTQEGLVGGVALATLVAAALALAASHLFPLPPDAAFAWPGPLKAAILGAALAVVGQAGDLFESLLKRDAGAKDSAAVVPAFGGLLDLLDSPLFCLPLAWWVLCPA